MRIKEYTRYELKYLLTGDQCRLLTEVMSAYLSPDTHGDNEGRYSITSLYYDTPDYQAYWDKIEGHRFRRKVRVRIYGQQAVTPDTSCFVEIKQRNNKTVQKKRVILPYSSADALCGSGVEVEADTLTEADYLVLQEIQYLQNALQLQPACIVNYDRLAFEGSEYDPALRVTFDSNLKGRVHDLTLLAHTYAENHFFLPPEQCVMEIKVNYRVPYWLTEVIGRYGCTLRRVSKYCTALEQCKALLQGQKILY